MTCERRSSWGREVYALHTGRGDLGIAFTDTVQKFLVSTKSKTHFTVKLKAHETHDNQRVRLFWLLVLHGTCHFCLLTSDFSRAEA